MTPKENALRLANKFLDNYLGKYKSDTHQRLMYRQHGIDDAKILIDEMIAVSENDHVTLGRNGLSDKEWWLATDYELRSL